MTFSKIMSKSGSIELNFNNMAGVDANCNEQTTLIGPLMKCEQVTATSLRISGFQRDIQVGEIITINFRATSSSATTGQVCARAFNDYPAVPTAQVAPVQLQVCDTFTYTSKPGIVWIEARTPTHIRRVQANERGMMTFQFNFATIVPKLTSTIRIVDSTMNFDDLETKDFECFFSNKTDRVAKSCVYVGATRTWEVKAPRSNDLTGWVTLTIITYRQNIEFPTRLEGIQMPLTGGPYSLTMTAVNAASTVLYTAPELNVNLPAPHFTNYFFNSFLIMKDAFSTYQLRI